MLNRHVRALMVALALIVVGQDAQHAQRVTTPRITPLPRAEWTTDDRDVLRPPADGSDPINVFTTCLRNLDLCRVWRPFASYVLGNNNSLPPRAREMLILRTSWNCRADYDWAHHVPSARNAGLSNDEIQRIAKGPDAAGWNALDAALLRANDELNRDHHISDRTWQALSAQYSEKQLMDLVFTVGEYTMVSMFLNSAGVQLEPGFSGLPK